MSSADLHVVECTFKCGFDSFRAHHLLSITYKAHRERSRQAESVGLASWDMAISFRISKLLVRPSEKCAVSFGGSVDPDLSSLLCPFMCKSLAVAFDARAP